MLAPPGTFAASVAEQRRADRYLWAQLYVGVLGVAGLLGVLTMRTAPAPFALPFTMLFAAALIVAVKPVAGVYMIAFFVLVTDSSISPSYPFGKNLSSGESILYVGNGLIISPLEILLAITLAAWLLRLLFERPAVTFVRGALFWPVTVFTGFLVLGFVYGLGKGGERTVAVWELRPILYLPVVYVLVTNLFTSRRHYHRLAAVMLVALVLHSILALQVLSNLSPVEFEALESLVGHGSAVQFNIVFVTAIAALVFPGTPRWMSVTALIAAIPVGWVYIVSERRAAMIGFSACVLFLGALLTKLDARRLRRIAPIFILLTVGYLGAFWNNDGSLGFPAQSIKTVIAPGQTSEQDQSSDIYREIENFDVVATIRSQPIVGLGFGQKFLRPIALPDISFFPFYEYIPHNSILWIWIKAGIGGFVAMLFVFARTLRMGVHAVLRASVGRDAVLAAAASSYVVSYAIFAYVDIAWDGRSMIVLAAAMGICGEFLRIPDEPTDPDDRGPRGGRRPTLRAVRQRPAVRSEEMWAPSRAA